MSDKKSAILRAAKGLTENYASEELFMPKSGRRLPNRSVIIDIVRDLKSIVFPGYFSTDTSATVFPEYYVGHRLNDLYDRLKNQIEIALLYHGEEPEEAATHADRTACGFFEQLPEIQRLLLTDVQAGFDGDPAAKSKEEIIFSYPGLFAIYVYRLAHVLYKEEIPFIPRVMSEYAHGRTGIDINPGATIGEYFFIDHGTGVVVGETTEIGNNVKLYQGVTLGGTGKEHGKRHPTIGNNVMISAGAKVLGSFTIGDNSKIGAGSVVLSEVPPGSTVVGVPGRVVKRNNASLPQETMNQTDLPDPVREDITVLQRENSELTNRVLEMEDELKQLRRLVVMSEEAKTDNTVKTGKDKS